MEEFLTCPVEEFVDSMALGLIFGAVSKTQVESACRDRFAKSKFKKYMSLIESTRMDMLSTLKSVH